MVNHSENGIITEAEVVVVMVPLPAQGHLNQLLQLSRLIASYNIPIHYVGTATHNRQARLRAHGCDPLSISNIHFHEFATPSLATPPPNPYASVKFPSQLQPSFDASLSLRNPVFEMLRKISTENKRVIVIFDSLMAWVVQDISLIPNAEPYCFQSVSAFCTLSFHYEFSGKSISYEDELFKDLPTRESCFTPEFNEFAKMQREARKFNYGTLYNTCKVIEGQFLDLLGTTNHSGTIQQWAIGPFNPVLKSTCTNEHVAITSESELSGISSRHECLEWLDKKAQNSVLYVSFGTTTSLADEQIQEILIGLEKSEQNFILVLREADKANIFVKEERKAQLPEGYEERIKDRGIITRDWAPQLEILGHPSTGGFMSHCGWNSCMEGISNGVPIATWPMHSDQPRNAILITKALKIGLIVKEWARRDELVTSTTIEKCVTRLMASPEGEDMRKRAAELSKGVKESLMEGGATRMEMDSFIAHITR